MFSTSYKEYQIEIINDETYTEGSADNTNHYDLVYKDPADDVYIPSSKHGVKVYRDGIYKSAILLAAGGGTGVYADSAIIDNDNLITRCCNKVFSLTLPDLQLNWITEGDWATCFSIHLYKESYIIHGEMFITRLARDGTIMWQAGARDIFVNINHQGDTFQMRDEYIELMDFQGYRYKLTYDGKITG